jgi:hypothetical protein
MATKLPPNDQCVIWNLGGKPLKAVRCKNAACGWDALKRRACRDHMPKALWPVESRAAVKPNAGAVGRP